jgi:hypothetical protein
MTNHTGDIRGAGGAAPVVVRTWPHTPRSIPRARHELRRNLEAWGLPLADTAEVVLSELLTNAVKHARSPRGRHIETRYEPTPDGCLRIEVHDANETWPVLKAPAADAESGHGLGLVHALTAGRWGVSERQGVGKLIWAVVTDDRTKGEPT